jgi:hypothetical protein
MVQAEGAFIPLAYSGVETRIAAGEWFVTDMVEGKQMATMRKVVSKDGTTLRITVNGVDPQGNAFEDVKVYDRQ